MFDHPPVLNVVHVVLRDPHLIEAADSGPAAAPTSSTSTDRRGETRAADTRALYRQQLGGGSNAVAVVSPGLIFERHDLATRVDGAAHLGEMRWAVVVPAMFVQSAQLKADRLAGFLRQDRRRFRRIGIAAAAVGVRA